MERVNKNLRIKQPHFIRRLQERLSIIRQEWEDLGEQIKATGPAAQEDLTIRRNGLYRLLTVAENATVNDKYLYSSIGDDLPFKTLAEAQEKFRSYKASAEASGATKILLPVNKRYIRLNKRNSMGIDQIQSSHANHLLIDLATKKYMLIEPQMPVYDHTKKMSEQFLIWAHYRILDRLGDDLIKPVFGDEFESVEVARRSCPQSIVRDKNCIWWSFMLTYLYISNMETTDINYIGKKIVSKYGAELPDLMNSFKVFCVGRILKVVKGDPGWAILMDSEFVRGLQGLTLAAAGGGRTKLMRRGRSTRKHHTKRHGKRTLRSS
jgi:hypothetical protein